MVGLGASFLSMTIQDVHLRFASGVQQGAPLRGFNGIQQKSQLCLQFADGFFDTLQEHREGTLGQQYAKGVQR